ncbi:hypothetical protein LOZ58_004842 [Ophidiomyces ophidiicola]|nr:hypothetical protein LOZ58_004842 [Ophidiomyces ophidiicola]
MSKLEPREAGLHFLGLHPFVRSVVQDKIRGTIVGSALGDCIGLYTEFLSSKIAHDAYPEGKFQLVHPATAFRYDSHRSKRIHPEISFDIGSWTDDTDHALLILLSYLHHDGEKLSPQDLAERLRIWVEQGLRALNRPPLGLGKTVGSVVLDKEYLVEPVATAHKQWVNSGRKMAPNGSLMRTHPVGIVCLGHDLEKTFQITTSVSVITHADPRCVVSCCVATGLVRGMLRGDILNETDVDGLIDDAYHWVDAWIRHGRVDDETIVRDPLLEFEQGELLDLEEFNKHVRAKTFQELELDDSMKMGYVYKCLGAAILSLRMGIRQVSFEMSADFTTTPSPSTIFEKIITELTFAAGDADTNACAAGALLGCWFGYNSLPAHWRDGMRDLDWLTQKCNGAIHILQKASGLSSDYRGSDDPDTRPDGGKGLMNRQELEKRDSDFMMKYMLKHAEGVEQEKKRLKQNKKNNKLWTGIFG